MPAGLRLTDDEMRQCRELWQARAKLRPAAQACGVSKSSLQRLWAQWEAERQAAILYAVHPIRRQLLEHGVEVLPPFHPISYGALFGNSATSRRLPLRTS